MLSIRLLVFKCLKISTLHMQNYTLSIFVLITFMLLTNQYVSAGNHTVDSEERCYQMPMVVEQRLEPIHRIEVTQNQGVVVEAQKNQMPFAFLRTWELVPTV
mmetsp:Transcript_22519/g.40941  ORF Transcript_22519/g.40941 Transcript_22519/m.40941 type:complete len:102 (+) Transcript_22519:33-338(+)